MTGVARIMSVILRGCGKRDGSRRTTECMRVEVEKHSWDPRCTHLGGASSRKRKAHDKNLGTEKPTSHIDPCPTVESRSISTAASRPIPLPEKRLSLAAGGTPLPPPRSTPISSSHRSISTKLALQACEASSPPCISPPAASSASVAAALLQHTAFPRAAAARRLQPEKANVGTNPASSTSAALSRTHRRKGILFFVRRFPLTTPQAASVPGECLKRVLARDYRSEEAASVGGSAGVPRTRM